MTTASSDEAGGFACTEAYRLWARYVHALHDRAVDIDERLEALNAACALIAPPAPPLLSIGVTRGQLVFVRGGKRHWFAHKNGRANPMLWAVFVEGGDRLNPTDTPVAMCEAVRPGAHIFTQEDLNRMVERAS